MSRALRRIEYVRVPLFATLAELRIAERRKSRLENAGYVLVNDGRSQVANMLTYRLPYTQAVQS